MRDFYTLTERGRARRLRGLAFKALEHYDLSMARLRLITNGTNGIFRVDTTDGQKFVLRVCLAGEIGHSAAQLNSEMLWLAALGRDTDLTVPMPLPARSGDLFVTASAPGVPEPRHCVVFGWVPGQDISERLTAPHIEKWGAFAARLHAHGAAFQPPPEFQIVRYDRPFPFDEPVVLFDEAHRALLPPPREALFRQALARVEAAIRRLCGSGEAPRVLHGDLHKWNVRVSRGRIGAVDFEDLMWGWPVQDIATTLYYHQLGDDYPAIRAAFRRGYETVSPWPERVPGEIDTFIAGRALVLANDVLLMPEWQAEAPAFMARAEKRLRAILEASPEIGEPL